MQPDTPHPPYSLAADLLSKFHTSAEWIQALWLLAVPALVLGLAYLIKETVVALARGRAEPERELLYSVYRDAEGGLLLYRHERDRTAGEALTRTLKRNRQQTGSKSERDLCR